MKVFALVKKLHMEASRELDPVGRGEESCVLAGPRPQVPQAQAKSLTQLPTLDGKVFLQDDPLSNSMRVRDCLLIHDVYAILDGCVDHWVSNLQNVRHSGCLATQRLAEADGLLAQVVQGLSAHLVCLTLPQDNLSPCPPPTPTLCHP